MSTPTRFRGQVKRNFTFLVSFANSVEDLGNPFGCEDFSSMAEAEKFIKENFFNNPFMASKGIYIISLYDPRTDISVLDICKCHWVNNQLVEEIF